MLPNIAPLVKNHLLTPLSGNPPEQPQRAPTAYPKMKYSKGEPWREKAVMNPEQEKALGDGWYDSGGLENADKVWMDSGQSDTA